MSTLTFAPSPRKGSPSLEFSRMVRRLWNFGTASEGSRGADLASHWKEAITAAELPTGSSTEVTFAASLSKVSTIAERLPVTESVRPKVSIEATSILHDLFRRGFVPDKIVPSVVGGVGITYRFPKAQVYFEVRLDVDSSDVVESVAFATDYSDKTRDRILYRDECESRQAFIDLIEQFG